MAGKIVKGLSATVTGAAATGILTFASTTGFYAGARCNLKAAGQDSLDVEISEVVGATTLKVRTARVAGSAPNYGQTDISAYNGGVLTQHEQLVFNKNDKPLD